MFFRAFGVLAGTVCLGTVLLSFFSALLLALSADLVLYASDSTLYSKTGFLNEGLGGKDYRTTFGATIGSNTSLTSTLGGIILGILISCLISCLITGALGAYALITGALGAGLTFGGSFLGIGLLAGLGFRAGPNFCSSCA